MLLVKLCVVALVCTSTGTCQGRTGNSSASPMPPADARRMSERQAAALRRQLMKDNYDYSRSEEQRKHPNFSTKPENTANIYYQKGSHFLHASEVAKSNSDKYSAEHDQIEQSGQHEQNEQYEPTDKQLNQYEQPGQYEHQQDIQPNKPGPAWSEQQTQFDGKDQEQYEAPVDHARPSYADADELPARDANEPRSQDQRDIDLARRHINPQEAQAMAPNPSYVPYRGEEQRVKPFSDLRGDTKPQYDYEQNDAARQPAQDQVENEDYNAEDQKAIDQQNISDSKDDEQSEYSQSKKQSRELYNEFGHTDRARGMRYYTKSPHARARAHRGRHSLNYNDPYDPPGRDHLAPPARHHYAQYAPPSRSQRARPAWNHAPSARNHYRPPQSVRTAPLDHNISKKDLLYYMDDTQLRRHNNEMSVDVPDEEELPPPRPSNSSRLTPSNPQARTVTTRAQNLPNTERVHKSIVVTVAPGNVTYKLLTVKTREGGRRRSQRRILEERGPQGVAIISLDHAPLPAFRLPRSRRQYMHDHLHSHRKPS
ncbi:hypothetical protein PYW08_010280 [Mythimna loreyi]|uniref:Uncharacterized protein n=1 Tax=Mythimna loreyi TaxID=667449 RepID=A0ACC2Q446_9NEOP|nr:hypothetical protein PYW08_010280 [Mythimna loreyi]